MARSTSFLTLLLSLLTFNSVTFSNRMMEDLPRTDDLVTKSLWRPVQEKVKDCVVQIFAQIAEFDWLQPYRTPAQYAAHGSGFFIKKADTADGLTQWEGEIVTNAHVVDQAIAVWIQIPSLGKRLIDVHIVSICPERDLALLRVADEELQYIRSQLSDIPFLQLGDSDTILRSDEVLALGYPLGQESLKSTSGMISGREQHLIQISAPINPGNSGGPLLNTQGQVIGINSSGITEAQNVGYAIPINDLKVILPDLHTVQLLRKPFLGILSVHATDALTSFLGNPVPGGCYVVDVLKGSPLAKAGVVAGDMIYEINGNKLDIYGEMKLPYCEDKVSLVDYVARLSIGQEVNLVVYRNGQRHEFTVQFCQSQVLPVRKVYPGYEKIDYEVFGGMVVMELTVNHLKALISQAPGLARYTELKNQAEPALIVTHIFPNSLLYKSRTVAPGITLKEVNGVPVKTLEDFRKAINAGFANNYFTLRVINNMTRAIDNLLVVLPFDKVLQQELELARTFHYPISKTVKELLQTAQLLPKKESK